MIDTVCGPIKLSDLGQTLIHEHIICSGSEFRQAFPGCFRRQEPPVSQNEPFGLDTVHHTILPEMREPWVSETAVRKMTAGNIINLYQGENI